MNRAGDVLAGRYGQRPSLSSLTSKNKTSIEGSVSNNITSIELPAEIESLIVGSDYWRTAKRNRYKMLARQGHLQSLAEWSDSHAAGEALAAQGIDRERTCHLVRRSSVSGLLKL